MSGVIGTIIGSGNSFDSNGRISAFTSPNAPSSPVRIECRTVTMINGHVADTWSNDQLVHLLKAASAEVTALESIGARSSEIDERKRRLRVGMAEVAKILDDRPAQEEG